MDLGETERCYAGIGFSQRVGFGERPAPPVVERHHGCADPAVSPIGLAMEAEIRNIRRLLDPCRAKAFPWFTPRRCTLTSISATAERLLPARYDVRGLCYGRERPARIRIAR